MRMRRRMTAKVTKKQATRTTDTAMTTMAATTTPADFQAALPAVMAAAMLRTSA
jgi:hypothetical protein